MFPSYPPIAPNYILCNCFSRSWIVYMNLKEADWDNYSDFSEIPSYDVYLALYLNDLEEENMLTGHLKNGIP
ncbi:hypothetical protein SK128_021641 [Halocaridina rubra]|uniref:Uncharacterized protein n=1 Tax=Halocaridina rubra TaxID=373956 RepID=A0AAN8WSW6_HALRR